MKILLYCRTDKGGMRTHVNYLKEAFSKNHDVKLLSQEDFNHINIYDGGYYFDITGYNKIKDSLKWCDIFHVHNPTSSNEFIIPFIKSNKPIVNTFHFSIGNEKLIFNKKAALLDSANKKLANIIGKVYSKRSSCYIAVGSQLKGILKKYNKTVVINNGISVEKFRKIKTKRYFDDFTIGYIGRVTFEKNVESLIEACIESNIKLVVAGLGKNLKNLKQKYQNVNVKFLSKQKYPPTKFYNSVDVFCNPSFIEANINLTVLEAMACEKSIIASGCGGEEKNIHERFGLVSKPDKESLKRNILKIKKMNLEKMGKEGRQEVLEKYNIKDMVAKVFSVYQQVLG